MTNDKITIGIVALAGPLDIDTLLLGEAYLQELGYNVIIAPSCFERTRYLAGTSDENRAIDLMMLFADDEVDIILNMRGGYGSNKIIPYIQNFNFSQYSKPFIGYSDITYIHIYLNQKWEIPTYHGPMINDLIKNDTLTTGSMIKTAIRRAPLNLKEVEFLGDESGIVYGNTIGGNLTIICSTLGTDNEIDTRGKILFLEEVNEEPYSVDRLLMQLVHSGKIQACSGIILGDFHAQDTEGIYQTIEEVLLPMNKIIAKNIPAGHTIPNITIPLGKYCQIDTASATISFE